MSEHKSSEREVPRSSITKDDPSMATQGRESHQASNGTASQPTSATSDLGSDDQLPEPPFGDYHGSIENEENGLGTKADVTDDGRVNIRINQQTKGLSSLLVPALRSQLDLVGSTSSDVPHVPAGLAPKAGENLPPPLNVVIHVVGSRGDVQPFVALGKVLKDSYGHRVRLATHPVFSDFVRGNGLEFFNIAGDPAELMAFMVKNPGLMPDFMTLRRGDIGKRRREIGNMIRRCWRSCIETGDGSGIEASDKNVEGWSQTEGTIGDASSDKPFVADAIIANPPSFAHIHCAEKLGIPLHMMFTMPWSPTQAFPHPLANIQSSNAASEMTNFISYGLVEMMTWQGLGDVINRFRQKSLGLEPVSATWAPGMLSRLKVPYTYCWSSALIPKPRDWAQHISISGFYFLNLATDYTPEPDLAEFLAAGPPPVYIGFGSIVVDDPNAMTKMIFDTVRKLGQRALVSKGWGGFGADQIGIPEGVFMLGNCPHDWLFQRVSAVVHHGGAGTTAAGIAAGRPTVVVPFFGDQPFWGAMVARAGAGPDPTPYKELTSDRLAESIQKALLPATVEKAKQLAESISNENGTKVGAQSFHQQLNVDHLRCTLCPIRSAVWRLKRTEIRLSAFAATILGNEKLISFTDLKLYRPMEHFTEDEPFEPLSGGASALVGTLGSMAMGIADMPVAALKAMKIHPDATRSNSGSSSKQKTGTSRQESSESSPELKDGSKPSSLAPTQSTSDLGQDSETSQSAGPENSGSGAGPETAHEIANQMTEAAAVSENVSGTQSPDSAQAQKQDSESNAQAEKPGKKDPKEVYEEVMGIGKGMMKVSSAGIKSPMDFTLGLARGFRNAPKLYGDDTVRKSEKVTGLSSGLRIAGKEFGYGFYDGISGLVTQPIEGAKKEGAAGFVKGFGKGIGGIVFKPGAAFWGIPGYTSQGIYKELMKRFGPSVENYIIASRTAQGYEDVSKSSEEERMAIVKRWKEIKPYIKRKQTLGEEAKSQLDQVRERSRSFGRRSRDSTPTASTKDTASSSKSKTKQTDSPSLARTDTTTSTGTMDSGVWSPVDTSDSYSQTTLSSEAPPPYSSIESHAPSRTDVKASSTDKEANSTQDEGDQDFEEAVRRSVLETSKGDASEDALIEKAIRASVAELEAAKAKGADNEQLQQAMEASIREATKGLRQEREEEQEIAEEQSELERALAASKEEHRERKSEEDKAKREEEIVMQYMMKQSLAEEEMRKKQQGT